MFQKLHVQGLGVLLLEYEPGHVGLGAKHRINHAPHVVAADRKRRHPLGIFVGDIREEVDHYGTGLILLQGEVDLGAHRVRRTSGRIDAHDSTLEYPALRKQDGEGFLPRSHCRCALAFRS